MGFLSILTIIFVIAKLIGLVAWGWWLVFTPMVIEVLSGIVVFFIAWKVT